MALGIATDPSVVFLWLLHNNAWNYRTYLLPLRSYGTAALFLCCACMHVEYNLVLFEANLKRGREHCGWVGVTYKVRSLGMWLKLETGMLLMLLLFSVL